MDTAAQHLSNEEYWKKELKMLKLLLLLIIANCGHLLPTDGGVEYYPPSVSDTMIRQWEAETVDCELSFKD